jgi:hypothetical protein
MYTLVHPTGGFTSSIFSQVTQLWRFLRKEDHREKMQQVTTMEEGHEMAHQQEMSLGILTTLSLLLLLSMPLLKFGLCKPRKNA